VGEYNSLALDSNDNPHISYYGNDNLKYAIWNGSGWVSQTVDAPGTVGQFNSLALDSNDDPHISYYSNNNLKYATWNGSGWVMQTIDTGGMRFSSLALDSNDAPHISYYDAIDEDLNYASAGEEIYTVYLPFLHRQHSAK
jgi:hypothetical protein